MHTNKIPQLKRWEVDRFWSENFKYNGQTGCLEWIKSVNPHGYGRAGIRGRSVFAHRLAYFIYYLEDPGDKLVMHKCDNPRCCNPFHLELGTHDDNSKDMVRKQRTQTGKSHWTKREPEYLAALTAQGKFGHGGNPHNGPNHPYTKLNAEQVKEILERRAECKGNRQLIGKCNRELAEKFGVTHSNISAVALGKSWTGKKKKAPYYPKTMTADKVKEFRARVANGETLTSVSKAFNLRLSSGWKIVHRWTWKHVL